MSMSHYATIFVAASLQYPFLSRYIIYPNWMPQKLLERENEREFVAKEEEMNRESVALQYRTQRKNAACSAPEVVFVASHHRSILFATLDTVGPNDLRFCNKNVINVIKIIVIYDYNISFNFSIKF